MARVQLIQEKSDVAPEHAALFDTLASRRGRISGPSSVVLHSPGLAGPWNLISEFLHGESIVEPEAYELAVCTTAREFDGTYIWAAHAPAARRAGVSGAAIEVVASHRDEASLASSEATIVRFTRQLLRDRRVDDATFFALLDAHGPRWMVELTAWIGRYAALSGIVNAFEVMPAPDADKLSTMDPQPSPSSVRTPLPSTRAPLLTSRDGVPEADRVLFDEIAEGRGSVRGPFALLLYSPALCRAVLDLSVYLRKDDYVPASTRELAVIATARERDCPYVWAAHAPAARKEGVPDTTIETVRHRGALDRLTPGERDVVEYTRQLLRAHRVERPLFDRMFVAHTLPGLVEITATIGHYVFVTTVLNAFEVSPAPGAEALPLG